MKIEGGIYRRIYDIQMSDPDDGEDASGKEVRA